MAQRHFPKHRLTRDVGKFFGREYLEGYHLSPPVVSQSVLLLAIGLDREEGWELTDSLIEKLEA